MSIGEIVRRRISGEQPGSATDAPAGKSASAKRSPVLQPKAPRVSLLPTELQAANRDTVIRRRLVIGVIGTLVVVALGVAGSAVYAMSQASAVASATAANSALSTQLVKYANVQTLQRTKDLATAAARVGSSTAIDWQSVLAGLETGMPGGFRITSVATDSASPIADYPQGSTPLDTQRVATVTLTAKANSISGLPAWLTAMQSVKGFADATPTVSADGGSGFTVAVTVHMTDAAYITPLSK